MEVLRRLGIQRTVIPRVSIRQFGQKSDKHPSQGYVPQKPPSMRKVVREKENYIRGTFTIDHDSISVLKRNQELSQSENSQDWYPVYRLP